MSRRFFQTDNEVALSILAAYGPSVFAVYSVLLLHMNRSTRITRVSQATIVSEANVSETTCKRSLHCLEDCGCIERRLGIGRGNQTEYCIKGSIENPFYLDPFISEKGPQATHLPTEKGPNIDLKGSKSDPLLNINGQESLQEDIGERLSHSNPPSLEAFLAHAKRTGVNAVAAELCWNHYEVKGWPNGGSKWDLVLKSWVLRDIQRAYEKVPSKNGTGSTAGKTFAEMAAAEEESIRRLGI